MTTYAQDMTQELADDIRLVKETLEEYDAMIVGCAEYIIQRMWDYRKGEYGSENGMELLHKLWTFLNEKFPTLPEGCPFTMADITGESEAQPNPDIYGSLWRC